MMIAFDKSPDLYYNQCTGRVMQFPIETDSLSELLVD